MDILNGKKLKIANSENMLTTSINKTFISEDIIREIYESHCKEIEISFNESQFEDFLNFLAIDIYDWVDGNLKYFDFDKYAKKHKKERHR